MTLRWHEIAERDHRILNPMTERQLDLLGEICDLAPGMWQLDLGCGKGEMLCRFASRHGIGGVGVDLSRVFLAAARARALELDVADRVAFVEHDAATYPVEREVYDVVSCIGATWIGGGLPGTLALMRPALSPGGLLLVGEVFWNELPSPEVASQFREVRPDMFTTLAGTNEQFEAAGFELVEMVLADAEGWERYEAPRWRAISDWLRENPEDPDAEEIRRWLAAMRREYLEVGRRYFGWGVLVSGSGSRTGSARGGPPVPHRLARPRPAARITRSRPGGRRRSRARTTRRGRAPRGGGPAGCARSRRSPVRKPGRPASPATMPAGASGARTDVRASRRLASANRRS